MGYNLKTSYFELGELDKGSGIATISTIFGSTNNSLQGHNTEVDKSIVDLKLGSSSSVDIQQGLINSFKDHRASLMNPFPSTVGGSSKRARTPSTGPQVVSCLVDGCNSDLSKCRDYHRRHKVCEMHSKTPRVTIGGHEQRFCQQCSRFHSLGEFDEGKRSCRKRLEGHNRRRRKPQPEALPANHGNFPSANQGHRFLGLSNQPTMIPTANSVVSGNTTWSGAIKNECNNPVPYSSSVSGSYYHAYRGSQFPFSSQTSDSSFTGASSAGQMFHHDPNSASGNGGNNNNGAVKLFCNNGMNQVIHTDRALSLLSSSPADTREMELGRVIHPSPIGPSQPVISGLHYNSMGQYLGPQSQGLEGQPGNSALISNLRSNINSSLCQDVFQQEVDESSSSGGHQTLSFSWE